MEKSTLLERINKKEIQISKLEKSLAKLLTPGEEMDIINRFLETGNRSEYRDWLHSHDLSYGGDAWSRANDLYDARITLLKYKNQLNAINDRDSVSKIDAIWNFLLAYKSKVIEYLNNNLNLYKQLRNKYSESYKEYKDNNTKRLEWFKACHKYNVEYYFEQEFKENYFQDIHPLTKKIYWDRLDINKYMDKEIESRYFKLINQVTKYTGEITDATNLSIHKGELNGVIIGENGKCHINTIGAGGYNIQCFHYRTLVKPIK